jgi:3-carboxy-cis,cis-muconate cycloisomerase
MMHVLDSLFRDATLEPVLTQENLLRKMLFFESALAESQAAVGMIPADAAKAIAAAATLDALDLDALANGAARSGNLAIPLVKQLTAAVKAKSPDAAGFVHWTATSQDVIDTAAVLQVREAARRILQENERLCSRLFDLTREYRETVMVGRTWLQHAAPITFGLKTARMLAMMMRRGARLAEAVERASRLQFGGAVGTLSSAGDVATKLRRELAVRLQLPESTVPWHSERDTLADVVASLGVLNGALAKIARDISMLAQTEIAEVSEHHEAGRGSSSTMPQKRNPVTTAAVIAITRRVPALVSTYLSAMDQEHERGLGGWLAEWEVLPELLSLVGGAVHHSANLFSGLEIHADRMAKNLELTAGSLFAEAASAALAQRIGKEQAHALVAKCPDVVRAKGTDLRTALSADETVRAHLTSRDLDEIFDPRNQLRTAQQWIDVVLAEYSSSRTKQANAVR